MRRSEARLQHLANGLAIGSGILFACGKYIRFGHDPYAASNNPWEEPTHNFHLLVVPLLIFACGVIWRSHILPKWYAVRARGVGINHAISGLGLMLVFIPMVLTGYLIQVAVDENWRKAWVVIHLVTSAAWSFSYVAHFLLRPKLLIKTMHSTNLPL